MEIETMRLLASVLALMPTIGVVIALGMIFSAYNLAVGRNPNSADALEKKFWLTFAFVEMFGLVAIVAWALLYFTG